MEGKSEKKGFYPRTIGKRQDSEGEPWLLSGQSSDIVWLRKPGFASRPVTGVRLGPEAFNVT
jgi:hypothetical protein